MTTTTTKATRRQLAQLDAQIERLYCRHAAGRQIDIMKIGQLYAYCRTVAAAGGDLEAAVVTAVAQYTEAAR